MSTTPSVPPKPRRHPKFYHEDGNTIFLVDNVLYKIHRSFLTDDPDSAFSMMFASPPGAGNDPQGSTDEDPIVIPLVTRREFSQLIGFLYASSALSWTALTSLGRYNWLNIFKMADKWSMIKLENRILKVVKEQIPGYTPTPPVSPIQIDYGRHRRISPSPPSVRSIPTLDDPSDPLLNTDPAIPHLDCLAICILRPKSFDREAFHSLFKALVARPNPLFAEEGEKLPGRWVACISSAREHVRSIAKPLLWNPELNGKHDFDGICDFWFKQAVIPLLGPDVPKPRRRRSSCRIYSKRPRSLSMDSGW